MQRISSTQAKQSFGELLEAAVRGPVAIEKHRKIKAIMASPQHFSAASREEAQLAERRAARVNQALRERDRLIKHQRIAIDLLTLPAMKRNALIQGARAVISHWRDERLCSQDYIEKWQSLLELPLGEMAKAMTSDAEGWGPALRQNSPWSAAPR